MVAFVSNGLRLISAATDWLVVQTVRVVVLPQGKFLAVKAGRDGSQILILHTLTPPLPADKLMGKWAAPA